MFRPDRSSVRREDPKVSDGKKNPTHPTPFFNRGPVSGQLARTTSVASEKPPAKPKPKCITLIKSAASAGVNFRATFDARPPGAPDPFNDFSRLMFMQKYTPKFKGPVPQEADEDACVNSSLG